MARWEAELVAVARKEGALRLHLGEVLEVLGRRGLCFELGFSSLTAYGLERCERSGRWVEGARTLARRLEVLPQLRGALRHGRISWSQAELVGRVARPEDEGQWVELAEARTVRQLQVLVKQSEARASGPGVLVASGEAAVADRGLEEEGLGASASSLEEACTIQCTVAREEAWLFEATRTLLDQLGVRGGPEQIEALLAEGQGTLLAALPRGAVDAEAIDPDVLEQRVGAFADSHSESAGCPSELEERGRNAVRLEAVSFEGCALEGAVFEAAVLEAESASSLDMRVRELAREWASQELELAQCLLRFHRAGGWRRLGYATEAQWAHERLGLSRSSVSTRRALAVRLEALPRVAAALGAAQIGVEAALQLVRVATASTEQAWVERARQRTIKHLREEVAAASVAVRLSRDRECWPPLESELEAFMELERAVVSGHLWRASAVDTEPRVVRRWRRLEPAEAESRRAWWVMLASLEQWLDAGLQTSAAGAAVGGLERQGRVVLRLRVSRSTAAWWRALEAQARPWLPSGWSWLKFLCLSCWQAWGHVTREQRAYGHIYVRDRFRCASPVCCRRDVTPHHLQFRSAGGSDAEHNVASVCTWCHLFGIHGGRIRARGTADLIHWELGASGQPCLVVHGRERRAA